MAQTGVIFDMDGVLILSKDAHWESWQLAGRQWGVELTYERFVACFGRTNPDCIATMFGPDTSAADSAAIAEAKENAYRQIVREHVPVAPGILELLAKLKARGIRMAIGTSAPVENVKLIVEAAHLDGFFDATANGSDVKRGKPAPDVFLLAAEKIGVAARRCAVVEDAPAGIEAAVAGGMLPIGVATTHAAEDLKRAGAAVVFEGTRDFLSDRFFRTVDSLQSRS
jgi:beta-phosphoglucomutase